MPESMESLDAEIALLRAQIAAEENKMATNAIDANITSTKRNRQESGMGDLVAFKRKVQKMSLDKVNEQMRDLAAELKEAESTPIVNENGEELFCVCRDVAGSIPMIACDSCDEWYHIACVGLTQYESACIESYVCFKCLGKSKKSMKLKPVSMIRSTLAQEASFFVTPSSIDSEIKKIQKVINKMEKAKPKTKASTPVRNTPSRPVSSDSFDNAADQLLIEKVRRAMKAHKLTQADVCEQSGVTGRHTTLSAWLNGKVVPKLKAKEAQLSEWLRTLGAPPDEFQKGSVIDAKDNEGLWYVAVIRKTKKGAVLVHYEEWDNTFDEWIDLDSGRLAALGTHTKSSGRVSKQHTNLSSCIICSEEGELLLCGGCPAAYHGHCFDPPVDVESAPNPWYCPDCEDKYKRVPIWCPGQSGVLRGDKAPFKKDLTQWLQDNPGWEIWDVQSAMKRAQGRG